MSSDKIEPIMSVERTREMLGSEVSSLTDEQVQEMIDSEISFCEVVIDNLSRNSDFKKLLQNNKNATVN